MTRPATEKFPTLLIGSELVLQPQPPLSAGAAEPDEEEVVPESLPPDEEVVPESLPPDEVVPPSVLPPESGPASATVGTPHLPAVQTADVHSSLRPQAAPSAFFAMQVLVPTVSQNFPAGQSMSAVQVVPQAPVVVLQMAPPCTGVAPAQSALLVHFPQEPSALAKGFAAVGQAMVFAVPKSPVAPAHLFATVSQAGFVAVLQAASLPAAHSTQAPLLLPAVRHAGFVVVGHAGSAPPLSFAQATQVLLVALYTGFSGLAKSPSQSA